VEVVEMVQIVQDSDILQQVVELKVKVADLAVEDHLHQELLED
jgi:hypothetical protein